MKKAIGYGILSSLFFAFTFILNRSMNLSGGNYLWSSSLRYIFTFPILFLLIIQRKEFSEVLTSIKENFFQWIFWSSIGFGLFYLPLSFASDHGESWLVAGTWQITIVAGILLTPLWRKKIPLLNLLISAVILIGVFLLQYGNFDTLDMSKNGLAFLAVLIAAFSYPLGNRKMMDICHGKLTTTQRVFGMTLCSMPFWILTSVVAVHRYSLPNSSQLFQSFIVAIFSGVLATLLFFKATDMVKHNPKHLAIIEATQAGEVIFTLLGGILFLQDSIPNTLGFAGISIIILGMFLNSYLSNQN